MLILGFVYFIPYILVLYDSFKSTVLIKPKADTFKFNVHIFVLSNIKNAAMKVSKIFVYVVWKTDDISLR